MGQVARSSVITERALRGLVLQTLKATPPHPLTILADVVPSTNIIEKHAGLGEVSEMEVFKDTKNVKGLVERSFTLENLRYHATHKIHKDAIAFDNTGTARNAIADMTAKAKLFPGKLVSDLIRLGGTAGNVSYDGVTYFNDAHPAEGDAAAQDNNLAGTGVTASAVLTDFQAARAALRKMKDSAGRPVNDGVAMDLVVVCPAELESVMRTVFLGQFISQTDNVEKGQARIIVDPRQTDLTDWYLFNIAGGKPFVVQEADPVSFMYLGDGTETFSMTGYAHASVEWMGRAGYQWWQRGIRTVNA